MKLGESTLSECENKKERSTKKFWEDRLKEVGVHKSPYRETPEEKIDNFTKRFDKLIKEHTANKEVLEIGCGYGRNLSSFDLCTNYTGIDFIPDLIHEAICNIKDSKKFYVATMNLRDLKSNTFSHLFDVIVGVSVITSVEYEFPKVLKILKSVLKPEGYILWLEEEWYRIDWNTE